MFIWRELVKTDAGCLFQFTYCVFEYILETEMNNADIEISKLIFSKKNIINAFNVRKKQRKI